MHLFLFPLCSAEVFCFTIADKRLKLNFGYQKRKCTKIAQLLDRKRQNSLWSTAIKHVTLKRIKGRFRNFSQGRSSFSSEESYTFLQYSFG